MHCTRGEILEAKPALEELGKRAVDLEAAFHFATLLRKAREHGELFDEAQRSFLEANGIKVRAGGTPLDDDTAAKWDKEVREWRKATVTLDDAKPITCDELKKDSKIEPWILASLGPFVVMPLDTLAGKNGAKGK